MIKIYNSLSNKIEEFKPIKENELSMYVCGSTVYDDIHKKWVSNIYILFSDNSNARKFRMFHVGDLILLSGELIYSSGDCEI